MTDAPIFAPRHQRLARLRIELQQAKEELAEQRMLAPFATRKALRLMDRVKRLTDEIAQAENPESAPLGDLLGQDADDRARIYRLLVKVPLAADLLYDILTELQGEVRKLGVVEVTLTGHVNRVRREVEKIVLMIDELSNEKLRAVLDNDDVLVNDLTTIIDRYLSQNLTITD